jgi:alpha-amylase
LTRFPLFLFCAICISVVCSLCDAGQPRPLTDEVFYQFMPIAWRDSDNDAQRFGDFDGMTASLDYLQYLGVTSVWMTPIFPSPAYHGYQHGPGDQLNTRFGTEPQFLNFIQQAHARGIKVFIDFVVYGISQDSIWYQSAHNNPASPYDAWLSFTNAANSTYDGSTYSTWNGATVGFVEWDLRSSGPAQLDANWAKHWLDPNNDGNPSDGIDGFRLDHVLEYNDHGPNGWGYNLIDFWMPWHAALRSVNPDVFTFCEQADWGLTGVSLMPAFGAAFTKPWEFAVRDALSSELTAGLYSQTTATLAAQPAGRHFLGTISDHDVDRVTSIMGGSLTKAKVAAVINMTSPFPPIIYYGDEIGMLGVKGNFGGDANDIPMREPFKWNAVAGPPMANYWILNAGAYNARYSQNNDGRSVQEQQGVSGSLLELYKQLIALRKTSPALKYGRYIPITNNNTRCYSFLRHAPGEQTLLVAVRIRNTTAATTFDLSNTTIPGGSTTVQDLLTGQFLTNLTDANKSAYPISMTAYSYRILAVNLTPNPPAPQSIDGVDLPAALGSFSLIATQDNTTILGDNINELDQLFVRPTPTGLRIGITGNLSADGTGLALLLDTTSGGQNVLNLSGYSPPPSGPNILTGLRLDAGFAPDHLYWINTAGGNLYIDQFTLPAAGTTVKTFRGQGMMGDGDGLLANGTNPNSMQCAMDNTNTLGVTDIAVDQAPTAKNGFDLFIPYADIGVAGLGGTIRIAAFILQSSGRVSNQWLPGLGGNQGMLNFAPDLTTVPGVQFATIPLSIAGDIDADGDVDATDEALFVDVLLGVNGDVNQMARSDLNHDGTPNALDVQFFSLARLAN